jgi:hypothetical protein
MKLYFLFSDILLVLQIFKIVIENEGQEAVTGTEEWFCAVKKEHTDGHNRPLVRSDGLFHI